MSTSIKAEIDKAHANLIDSYFKYIRRVSSLESLLPYVGNNVQYLFSWWNEARRRGIDHSRFNVLDMLKKRVWRNRIELELFGRIVYREGVYNQIEDLRGFVNEKEDAFVVEFQKVFG